MNSFDKVIGYESEKEELLRLCDVLKNNTKYLRLGVKTPKAILLHGEPGLGKTLMAKAFIAETGRKVFHCKKNSSNGEFVNEIKATFENAIKEAPSIIFFDDMDKFAEDNLQQNCNKEEFVAIQTGLEDIADKDVFVIATANEIHNLPDSLMREGRFGRQIVFQKPIFEDSVKIVNYYLSDKPIAPAVKTESVARILQGKSCVVLESVINEAGIFAAYAGRDNITYDDVKQAVEKVVLKRYPLNNIDADRKMKIAYHEAGHALMQILANKTVGYVAIGKCGEDGLGVGVCASYVMPTPYSYEEFQNYIRMLLAGRASVEIQFNEIDLGALRDLDSAMSEIEDNMERFAAYGLEFLYVKGGYSHAQSARQNDKNQDKKIRLIEEYYNQTKAALLQNKPLLDKLAYALFKKEVLLYDEIEDIVCEVRS